MSSLDDSPIKERKRVKVYELRDNDWFDKGTGFCVVNTISESARICVESEEEPETLLLEVRIKKDDNYQKQQETLIVWTDQAGVDMAMSFQEADGCSIVWSSIGQAQQQLEDTGPSITHIILPTPELGNLEEIEAVVRGASNSQQGRDALAKTIVLDDYILRLTSLVQIAEDFEDLDDLHRLCIIIKTLILFNDNQVIEYIVRDDVIQGAVGALEYDPDFPHHKANHRQYLTDNSKFKEVVHIGDDEIRQKIHYTYRLQYLKDVALARILDDPSFSLFNSLIYFHQIDIVQHIATNAVFLKELFSIITGPEAPAQKKKDAVAFLQQSCSVAKGLQAPCRASLFQNLIDLGLFNTITFALQHRDPTVRVAGTDILVAVIDHDVLMMRNSVYKSVHDKTKPMTDTLIDLLLVETDLGVKAQVADAITVLLDSNSGGPPERFMGNENSPVAKLRSSPINTTQSDAFLATFFEHSAKKLFQPLKDLEHRTLFSDFSIHQVSLYSHLVEILCFFLRQHSYHSKYFILHQQLAPRVAQLTRCPEKHLKLTTIKFFRTCLSLQDDHHNRQMMNHNLFEPILEIVKENLPRDNLLTSACLELFEFIRKEGFKVLLDYLVGRHRDALRSLDSIEVFRGLLLRHDQIHSGAPQTNNGDFDSSLMTSDADTPNTRHVMISGGGLRWQGLKDTDADEEAYFNAAGEDEEDEDEDEDEDELSRDHVLPNGASPLAKPLVDYGPDDDDDGEEQAEEEQEQEEVNFSFVHQDPQTISESPPAKKRRTMFNEKSSSPQTPPRSDDTMTSPNTGGTAPSSTPPTAPPVSIAEKRRREDDDDDQLGKLSKRRNSGSNSSSRNSEKEPSIPEEEEQRSSQSPENDTNVSNLSNEPEGKETGTESLTLRQQTLRRKRAFSNQPSGGRKIAFSLATGVSSSSSNNNNDNSNDNDNTSRESNGRDTNQ